MNGLDLLIYVYQTCILIKLFTNVSIALLLFIWSIILLASTDDATMRTILIGFIVCSLLSLFYSIKTLFRGTHSIYVEFWRCFLLAWAIYSTVALTTTVEWLSTLDKTVMITLNALLYVIALSQLWVVHFPYGENGEIRA
jgi:hypothetical protein